MAIFYSAARGGFFDPDIHDPLPDDAVRITPARHVELLQAQETGAKIVPSERGTPVIRRPLSSAAEQRDDIAQRIRREAKRRIGATSPIWRQINDLREPSPAGAARFAAIDAVRAAADAIEREIRRCPTAELPDFPIHDHSLWPEEAP